MPRQKITKFRLIDHFDYYATESRCVDSCLGVYSYEFFRFIPTKVKAHKNFLFTESSLALKVKNTKLIIGGDENEVGFIHWSILY